MDDFPGLVHFIYVDRSTHQMTVPSLDLFPDFESSSTEHDEFLESCKATRKMTKERVWSMVEFARSQLVDGQHSVMWKDTTFSYAFFLWFEDKNRTLLSPEELEEDVLSALPVPGILSDDFYRLLTAHCFPNQVSTFLSQPINCITSPAKSDITWVIPLRKIIITRKLTQLPTGLLTYYTSIISMWGLPTKITAKPNLLNLRRIQ